MTHRLRALVALLSLVGLVALLPATTQAQTADLRLSASAPDTLTVGDTLRVIATVRNAGPAAAAEVVVLDTLGRRLAPALPLPGLCAPYATAPMIVRCDLGSLAAGDSATVALALVTEATGVARQRWVVQAATPDPDTTSNVLPLSHVLTPRTTLAATLTPSAAALQVGQYARFDLAVTNTGTSPARDVQLETVLDGLQAIDDPCATPCSFDLLAPGDTVRTQVAGRALQVGLLFVSALVTSPDVEAVTAARTAFVSPATVAAFVGLLAGAARPDGWTVRLDGEPIVADVPPGTGTGVLSLSLSSAAPTFTFGSGPDGDVLSATPSLLVAAEDTVLFPSRWLLLLADRPDGPTLLTAANPQLAVADTRRVALYVAHAATAGPVAVRRIGDTPEHAVLETLIEDLDLLQVSDPLALEPEVHLFEVGTTAGLPAFVQFTLDLAPYAGEPLFLTLIDDPEGEAPVPAVLRLTGARVDARIVTSTTGSDEAPAAFALLPNYPNPFNPRTTIGYTTPEPASVRLTVYDALGRAVAVLVDAQRPAGRHRATFDATPLPSGTYWVTLNAGSFRSTRPLLLVK